jgi:MFS family permease
MPAIFQEKGFDAIQSGTYTLWIGTFICLTAAILVATMLKPGSRQSKPSRSSLKDLFRDGLFAAKSDSRIRLAFVASAAARGDIFVVGIFTFLWMSNFALDNGLSINQGYARGAFVIPIIAGTVLITSPIFGFIMDRIDRIYGVMIAFSLSTIGYTMMGLVNDPMSNTIIPIAIILGAGEGACIISSTTLIGKTAPITIRGTVFGAFAMCGAIGQIIAGGVGGILFDYIYTGPFLLMGGMNFLVLLMAIYTWLSRKKASNSS